MSGLREKKKQRTRETIAEAALDLFVERGFAETTLAQIAAAADVSPRTVSTYFPVKEELAFAHSAAIQDSLRRAFASRPDGVTAIAALEGWLAEFVESDVGRSKRSRQLRQLVDSDPALRAYEQVVLAETALVVAEAVAVDLDLPPDHEVPHMVGAATLAVFHSLGHIADGETSPERARDLIDEALRFIDGGMRALMESRRGRLR